MNKWILVLVLLGMPGFALGDCSGELNLNNASAEEIASTMDGVGPNKAAAIVALRNDLGGKFYSFSQVVRAEGVGKSVLLRNRCKLAKLD